MSEAVAVSDTQRVPDMILISGGELKHLVEITRAVSFVTPG